VPDADADARTETSPQAPISLPRTVDWRGDHLVAVDQTVLPHEVRVVALRTVDDVVDAIARLVVRGAPAIGVAGALGVALAAVLAERDGDGPGRVRADAARVRAARPTAVNLGWAVDRVLARLDDGTDAVVAEAVSMLQEDVDTNRALAARGADLVTDLCGAPVRVHTHCNAGGLACVEWGTALGIVRALHERGQLAEVLVDETRPLLQGARLTAFELAAMGVRHHVVVDGAAAGLIAGGHVDVVIVGADRVAANGDVVNKVGTFPLALAARRAGVPFVVAAPESTLDLATPTGADVHVEQRDPSEVVEIGGRRVVPSGTGALNPAFDVTPWDLVSALVTEARVVRLAEGETVADAAGAGRR
jgi:S-methyl-5-thioribose-1-phosphate isomerase